MYCKTEFVSVGYFHLVLFVSRGFKNALNSNETTENNGYLSKLLKNHTYHPYFWV